MMMERIASDRRRAFFLRAMEPDEELGSPFDGAYPALVWATRPTSAAQKRRLAEALIATGCRYVVCGGVECPAWEHAADLAYIQQDLPEPIADERFVMTTSHRGEPEGEVAFFFANNTNFDAHDFTRYLVLLIGDDPLTRERLIAAVREEVEVS
jgi:hypothetical protein